MLILSDFDIRNVENMCDLDDKSNLQAWRDLKLERILVPTDGSGQAFKALSQAIHIAAACDAELTLLMTVDLNENVSAFEQVSLSGYVPGELKTAAFQFLAELMHVIPREIRALPRVEVGAPGEVIVDLAESEEYDMIIMGSRGFGTFRSLLMGSVSSYVLRHARCPVILVKGMPDDWEDDDNYILPWGE